MSVQPALAGRALERLFTPGIRLGWTFRDRNSLGTPFLEPHPDPGFIDKQIAERVAITQSRYARARRWVIKPSLVLGLVLLLLAGYKNGTHRAGAGYVLLAAAVIVTGSGLGYTIRSWWRKRRAAAARPERSYRKAVQAWQQRAIAHEQAELARAGNVPEWSAAGSPTLRTGSTNTPSNPPSCRTSPTALSYSRCLGRSVRNSSPSNATLPSPTSPASALSGQCSVPSPLVATIPSCHRPHLQPGQHHPAGSPRPSGRFRSRDRAARRAATALDEPHRLSSLQPQSRSSRGWISDMFLYSARVGT